MKSNTTFKPRKRAVLLLFVYITSSILQSIPIYALTSGPSQPEFTSFQPIGSTEMVDLFTGNFNYNIPLLNIPGIEGGYPINLVYNSVVNVDEEASMVGLGWTLGIGSITRDVRGIPDDFTGEQITRTTKIKPNISVGFNYKPKPEFLGLDATKGIKDPKLSFNINYDIYNGLGYSLGVGLPLFENDKIAGDLNLTSSSGDGLSYSIGVSRQFKKLTGGSINGGIGFSGNSIDGLQGVNFQSNLKADATNIANDNDKPYSIGSFTLNDRPATMPSQDLEYKGFNASINLDGGIELFGAKLSNSFGGIYSSRSLKHEIVNTPAYGYVNIDEGRKISQALLDFNRTNERPYHKNVLNLPIGSVTPDMYSISGQGVGGSFMFHRDDSGTTVDRYTKSISGGFRLETEGAGGNLFEIGLDGGGNGSITTNNARKVNTSAIEFTSDELSSIKQKGHFRMLSEVTGSISSENSTNPIRNSLIQPNHYLAENNKVAMRFNVLTNKKSELNGLLLDEKNNVPVTSHDRRRPRKDAIIHYLQSNIFKDNASNSVIPYLDVKISNSDDYSTLTNYPQLKNKKQIAAFEQVTSSGVRYVYGLPVKNKVKNEAVFSVANRTDICDNIIDIPFIDNDPSKGIDRKKGAVGSEDLLDYTSTPEFVHSYLLTSVLGDNYIDTNPGDGLPNDSDKGYWVKFIYQKAQDFKWRVPFYGAIYNPGYHSLKSDDKASYSYGEREQYYPHVIETSTHKAVFYYLDRDDNQSALIELQNTSSKDPNRKTKKLDKIILYTKGENATTTIEKTIQFRYNYSLCPGAYNSTAGGKLTLEKLEINSYNSTRGTLTPYTFEYNNVAGVSYGPEKFDRWGVYKPDGSNTCQNFYNPYADQNPASANINVGAFHLNKITLPSGAIINVQVGRDHYQHVQNKVATQFIPIAGIGNDEDDIGNQKINPLLAADHDDNSILFDASDSDNIEDYIGDLYRDEKGEQVLFKLYSNLLEENKNNYDYVMGAAYIKSASITNGIGKITFKPMKLGTLSIETHPFLLTNWQFLKVNLRRLLSPGLNLNADASTGDQIVSNLKKMAAVFTNFHELFISFYTKARIKGYGTKIDLQKSFIRLNNPIKKKFGGDVRVEKVWITNVWDKDGLGNDIIQYGNVYIYEEEINGRFVSTGVASNEPHQGKEENAMYHIDAITEHLRYNTNEIRYELAPYNDVNAPGPSVGYRKVIVRSLPSQIMYEKSKGITPPLHFEGLEPATTGQAVHEFFTAKEFPTIFTSTVPDRHVYPIKYIPLLFLGMIATNEVTATQGYQIETNDMHGKPRKVTYTPQAKSGKMVDKLVSSGVTYEYFSKKVTKPWGKRMLDYYELDNDQIPMHVDYQSPKTVIGELGVCRSMNTDIQLETNSYKAGGVDFSSNNFWAFVPFLSVTGFPNILTNDSKLETAVTDKHIRRSGILKKTIAFDGQSMVETENLVFDPYTGQPVITSVNDHFDQKKYAYNIPAYLGYQRMGAAFSNVGFEFSHNNLSVIDKCTGFVGIQYPVNSTPAWSNELVPGDEFILTFLNPVNQNPEKLIAVFQKKVLSCCDATKNNLLFHIKELGSNLTFFSNYPSFPKNFKCYRSGNRNLLAQEGQSMTSLGDPRLNSYSDVLSAGTNTYCDFWQFDSPQDSICNLSGCIYLPMSDHAWVNSCNNFGQNNSLLFCEKRLTPLCSGAGGSQGIFHRSHFKFNSTELEQRLALGHVVSSAELLIKSENAIPSNVIGRLHIMYEEWSSNLLSINNLISSWSNDLVFNPSNTNHAINIPTNGVDFDEWKLNGFLLKLPDETINLIREYRIHGANPPVGISAPTVKICFNNQNEDPMPCSIPPSMVKNPIDPFTKGAKGIFKMEAQYGYNDTRMNSDMVDIKRKGIFEHPFDLFNWRTPNHSSTPTSQVRWLVGNKVTKRSPSGEVLETKNALDIYNSLLSVPIHKQNDAIYRNDLSTTVASVSNGRYYESAFTSFESYEDHPSTTNHENWNHIDLMSARPLCGQEKFRVLAYDFYEGSPRLLIDKKYNGYKRYDEQSVEVYTEDIYNGSDYSSYHTKITDETLDAATSYTWLTLASNYNCDAMDNNVPAKVIINRCDDANPAIPRTFSPIAHSGKKSLLIAAPTTQIVNKTLELNSSKEYYASVWVFDGLESRQKLTTDHVNITIYDDQILKPIGFKINGWQQYAGKFMMDNPAKKYSELVVTNNIGTINIDDLRIHPFEAKMESYVYDPNTFLLTHILDDNNYFTKYVYDGEGKLVSIQKETERGVKTIQEQRSFISPLVSTGMRKNFDLLNPKFLQK